MQKLTEGEDKFLKENPIIFKKFRVKKKLGEGAFGEVYTGFSIENDELVAIKIEPRKILKPLLDSEAFFLYTLKGFGIPEVISFGRVKQYSVLIQPLLGKSLFDLFAEKHRRFNILDVCLIAIQILDRIQWVHSKFIVHRDIKPDNFLLGRKDPNIIYLIDFGLSKKYKSSTTGKHLKFGFTGKLTGTVRFASANALRGGEQSRKDDLESVGYMLIYFMKGRLPWQGITGNKKMERYLKIYKIKKRIKPEDLCKGLHEEICEYIKYVRSLDFEEDPDYNYLRSLFKKVISKVTESSDKLLFSWLKQSEIIIKLPANLSTRRESPQSRLLKRIQSNLETGQNSNSSNNNSQPDSYELKFNNSSKGVYENGIKEEKEKDTEIDSNNCESRNFRNSRQIEEKSKDLITTLTNYNFTIDENVIDFDGEKIIGGSDITLPNVLSENKTNQSSKSPQKEKDNLTFTGKVNYRKKLINNENNNIKSNSKFGSNNNSNEIEIGKKDKKNFSSDKKMNSIKKPSNSEDKDINNNKIITYKKISVHNLRKETQSKNNNSNKVLYIENKNVENPNLIGNKSKVNHNDYNSRENSNEKNSFSRGSNNNSPEIYMKKYISYDRPIYNKMDKSRKFNVFQNNRMGEMNDKNSSIYDKKNNYSQNCNYLTNNKNITSKSGDQKKVSNQMFVGKENNRLIIDTDDYNEPYFEGPDLDYLEENINSNYDNKKKIVKTCPNQKNENNIKNINKPIYNIQNKNIVLNNYGNKSKLNYRNFGNNEKISNLDKYKYNSIKYSSSENLREDYNKDCIIV